MRRRVRDERSLWAEERGIEPRRRGMVCREVRESGQRTIRRGPSGHPGRHLACRHSAPPRIRRFFWTRVCRAYPMRVQESRTMSRTARPGVANAHLGNPSQDLPHGTIAILLRQNLPDGDTRPFLHAGSQSQPTGRSRRGWPGQACPGGVRARPINLLSLRDRDAGCRVPCSRPREHARGMPSSEPLIPYFTKPYGPHRVENSLLRTIHRAKMAVEARNRGPGRRRSRKRSKDS